MTESEEVRKIKVIKTIPGIGLPAGTDYPNLEEIPSEPCKEVFWRKEVANSFEIANNGYTFHRIQNVVFAKDLSGYWYRLNNETKCFEFLFEGFKDTTDYTRVNLPPQAPTFVGFNYLHQAVFPMNDDGRPILPKDDRGKTIFPFYDGYPLFPVDDSGAVCVPLGDDGKPVFPRIHEEYGAYVPCDITGRVVLPLNEKGEPIYPKDEEGNVLMPFIILEDGSRKRAVYVADDGTPILPFHNGEHALEVHEGEVLFQYEYQQKMMMLAQFTGQEREAAPMDEQFYQQHAQHYQNQMEMNDNDPNSYHLHFQHSPNNSASSPNAQGKKSAPAQNLLLKQLTFMKKKQETPTEKVVVEKTGKPSIPSERPAKPNKEKERGERYIPEPSRRNRRFSPPRSSSSSLGRRRERSRDKRRQRSRSRSLTWSPEPNRRSGRDEKYSTKRKNRDSRSPSYDREKRREKSEKYRK